jgi:hypothetical protein
MPQPLLHHQLQHCHPLQRASDKKVPQQAVRGGGGWGMGGGGLVGGGWEVGEGSGGEGTY